MRHDHRVETRSGRETARTSGGSSEFASDVRYYLTQDPRQLPSRYLYDDLGSALFEAICRLPWYPITRAEGSLVERFAPDIFRATGRIGRIVELGPGSGEKLAQLLSRGEDPGRLEIHLVDLSPAALAAAARTVEDAGTVHVVTHEASYEDGLFELAGSLDRRSRSLVLFLGSNIGNFDAPGAAEFLRRIRDSLGDDDMFLIGTDLVKPERDLLLAYDDPLGVTAAFNKNLLTRINRELDGGFELSRFAHRATWDHSNSRVEMHLVTLERQQVAIPGADLELSLDAGETIWTESSYKYESSQVTAMLEAAGFGVVEQWVEEKDRFALTLATALRGAPA